MIVERADALSSPFVSFSILSATSGGQSLSLRSCDSRPLDTPILALKSVRETAPSRFRYSSSVMPIGLDYLNGGLQAESLEKRNAFGDAGGYNGRMAAPRFDWYLKDWLHALSKKQADIVRDLDWNKAKVSLMIRGLQPYTREEVNELAEYLNIRPHELLLPPEEAFAARRLRADMIRLAHQAEEVEQESEQKKVSLN